MVNIITLSNIERHAPSFEMNQYNDIEYFSITLLYDKYIAFSKHKIMYIDYESGLL